MISIFFEFLTRGLIWILKSIFDMISFFMRQLFRLLRLFLVLLPVTGIVYSAFYFILVVEILAGEDIFSALLPIHVDALGVKGLILDTLKGYLHLLSAYSGTLMYFLLLLILLILFLPLSLTFIAIGTFVFSGKFLLIAILADAVIYVLKCLFTGKSLFQVIKKRYQKLFPKSGKRIAERSYDRWLSRHSEEFDDNAYQKSYRKSPLEEFYEDYEGSESYEYDDALYDEDYDENEYSEDDYDEEDDYEDNYYDYRKSFRPRYYKKANLRQKSSRRNYIDEFEDDEDSDDNEDLRIEDKRNNRNARSDRQKNKDTQQKSNPDQSFNFFAGCNSLESANRKYKSLVKLYHPDNMDGDTSALQEINIQYSAIKKRLS